MRLRGWPRRRLGAAIRAWRKFANDTAIIGLEDDYAKSFHYFGAGAVVRGTVPDHVVLGGVPAKVLRYYDQVTGWQDGPLRS